MATIKEIYTQLNVLIEELEYIVETDDNANMASDIQKEVLDRVEYAAIQLDGIIADKDAGLYENDTDDEKLEEDEDSW
tara:strand:+ start:226 stop:459 length:234 start_codon:yes stop_codon:yes gene_type:complete